MKLQAVRRRFDKRIYIPLPDFKARQHMFKVLILPNRLKLLAISCAQLKRSMDFSNDSPLVILAPNVLF